MVKCPVSPPVPKLMGKFGVRDCLEDKCGWWTGKECAIVTIAKALQGKPKEVKT